MRANDMESLSRRAFLSGAGVVAASVGLGPAMSLQPAYADPSEVIGKIFDEGGEVFDVRRYGVKGDTRVVTGGSMTSGSPTLTAAAATFASGDVGKVVTVQGAGAAGAVLSTTIATYLTPAIVTLAHAASTSVSGAEFAFGTDDTAALVGAVAAAGERGRLYAPVGIYMIRGSSNGGRPIEIAGSGGLLGAGGSGSNAQLGNTVFLCGDDTAGLLANGSGTFESFQCHGNNIGLVPLQNGSVVDGVAVGDSRDATFIAVWTYNSAGAGWTIRGAQNNTYYTCRSRLNRGAGVHIDGGSGGLHFGYFHAVHNRIDIVGDKLVPGGPATHGNHTEDVRFQSGILDSSSNQGVRENKIKLRGAVNWSIAMAIVGTAANPVATVDLDQSDGYGIDFTGSWIFARAQNPGILVNGTPPSGATRRAFVITDDVKWIGNRSVVLAGAGAYRYSARGWMTEKPPTGAAGGPLIDTLLTGRTGPWITPVLAAGWNANVRYRVNADGAIQLKGSATSTTTGGGGPIFTLQLGCRPAQTLTIAAAHTNGVGVITVQTDGVVSATGLAQNEAVFLDGITFVPA